VGRRGTLYCVFVLRCRPPVLPRDLDALLMPFVAGRVERESKGVGETGNWGSGGRAGYVCGLA